MYSQISNSMLIDQNSQLIFMIENQVRHTLFCQDVNMGIQKYFTHTFDSLFITYLNLEAFKI